MENKLGEANGRNGNSNPTRDAPYCAFWWGVCFPRGDGTAWPSEHPSSFTFFSRWNASKKHAAQWIEAIQMTRYTRSELVWQ